MNRSQWGTLLLVLVTLLLMPGIVAGANLNPFLVKIQPQILKDQGRSTTKASHYVFDASGEKESDTSNLPSIQNGSNVLLLHLDEFNSAITFADSSGYENSGECSGASCPTAGVDGSVNKALRFDGVDDYVSLGNPVSMNFVGEITLEAWVNVQATDGIRNIVAHGYTRSPNAEVLLRIEDGEYEVGSWDGIGHATAYPIPAEDIGNWVYLAGVYDGESWRLYRNGVEVSFTVDPTGSLLVDGDWAIGAHGAGTERFFQGLIDEVAIHNQALSPQEILAHYNSPGGMKELASEVVPIDWQRFDYIIPQDPDLIQASTILLNSARYNMGWIEQTFVEDSERGMYLVTNMTEHGIRPPASAVYGLAMILKTGIFNQDIVGASKEEVLSSTVKLIKGVAATHTVNSHREGGWGDDYDCQAISGVKECQSTLWAALLGQAGWMLWDDLDSETQHMLSLVVEFEANRFITPDYQVPYWNGVGGDSKAEENAWDAMLLQVAIAMMPEYFRTPQWKEICSELMVSAFAREEDMNNRTLILDGKSVQEWLNGYNLRADGVVINHDLIHNDYMTTITLNMHAILSQSLAGKWVPEAADFNFGVVYQSLVTNYFPSPPYEAPGGTMYILGQAEQYYPEGTDWSRYRFDIFYLMDVYAHLFGYDSNLPHKAQQWLRLRGQKIFDMQSRHPDGHIYAEGEYDNYGGREQLAIWQLADAFLVFWLHSQNAISEQANWLETSLVTGQITDWRGTPFSGITISAGSILSTTTNSSGTYTITNLLANNYTITPTLSGYSFLPPTRTLTVPPNAVDQDFIILPGPVSTTLTLGSGTLSLPASLIYTDTQSLSVRLDIPVGAVTQTTEVILQPTLVSNVVDFAFAGHAFDLITSQGEGVQSDLVFNTPATITIHYGEKDVYTVSDEYMLALWWWMGDRWVDAATTCMPQSTYSRDPDSHILSIPICRSGRYALFGPTNRVYLPLIFR